MTSNPPTPDRESPPNHYGSETFSHKNSPVAGNTPLESYISQPPAYPASIANPMVTQSTSTSNKLAISSLVLSLTVFVLLWIIPIVGVGCSLLGIVLGKQALKEANSYGSSNGVALAGTIVGYVSLAISALWTAFWVYWLIVFLSEVKM